MKVSVYSSDLGNVRERTISISNASLLYARLIAELESTCGFRIIYYGCLCLIFFYKKIWLKLHLMIFLLLLYGY